MRILLKSVILLLFIFYSVDSYGTDLKPGDKIVTIQLKWLNQFQFAGYYAAKEKGFFAKEGLKVVLRQRDPKTSNIQDVLQGKGEYGVADAGLVLSRLKGKPVVLLSQIFQHSPLVMLATKNSGIRTPYDLKGKRVMADFKGNSNAPLIAMFLKTIGGLQSLKIKPHTYRNDDLMTGKIDAMIAYMTNEPFWFNQRNQKISVLDPRDYGIDFYGDNLFTTENEIKAHPQRVEKVIRATNLGWKYALAHTEEIVDLIIQKYNTQNLSRAHLLYEANQIKKYVLADFIELGSYEPSRYNKIAETYALLKMAGNSRVDSNFFYSQRKSSEKKSVNLTEREKKWLAEHPTVRIGVAKDWPPMNFLDHTGAPSGIGIDYIKALNKRLGITFKIVPGSFKENLEKVKNKQLDALMDVTQMPERELFLNFTQPYLNIPHVIVARQKGPFYKKEAELNGKTVALERGFYNITYFKKNFPKVKIKEYPDTAMAIGAVALGHADAYAGNRVVAAWIMEEKLISNLQFQGQLNKTGSVLSIGVRKDWQQLSPILNKALKNLSNKEIRKIRTRWAGFDKAQTKAKEKVPVKVTDKAKGNETTVSYKDVISYSVVVLVLISLISLILIRIARKEKIAVNFGSRLFRSIVVVGLTIFILFACFLGWFTLELNKKRVLNDVNMNLRGVLKVTEEQLEMWVEERTLLMKLIGRNPELSELTRKLLSVQPGKSSLLSSNELREVRKFFKNNPDIFPNMGFFIINSDNISVGSMRNLNVGTLNLISKKYPDIIKRASEGEVIFVPPMESDVQLEKDSKARKKPPTMFFIGPIMDTGGKVIALMTLRVDPWKDLSKRLRHHMGKTLETYAFNKEGKLLSGSRFENQLRKIGLIKSYQHSALNIEIRNPGGNLVEGFKPVKKIKDWPLTAMASSVIQLKQDMEKAGIFKGHSRIISNLKGYRDYRGVPVFGAWLWNADMQIGLTTEVDVTEALFTYFMIRTMVFSILGFTLFVSVGAVMLVLILGERTSSALMKVKEELEDSVMERTSALKETMEHNRNILNSTSEGIFGVDIEGKVIFVNPAACKMLLYSEDELSGRGIHSIIHHSHLDRSEYLIEHCPMHKAYTLGSMHSVDDEVLWRKDGSYFFTEYTATPIRQNDEVVGAVIVFRDITDRKKAAEDLTKLSQAIEYSPAVVVVTDNEGTIEYVNPKFTDVTGYTFDEAIGQNPRILKSEKNPPSLYEGLWKTLSSGGVWQGEMINKIKSGKEIWEAVSISPITDANGAITHFVAVKENISERKQAEEKVRQNAAELEAFNKAMIGREKRIIEVKMEVNRLCRELGLQEFYTGNLEEEQKVEISPTQMKPETMEPLEVSENLFDEDQIKELTFERLFDLDEIQTLQDAFAKATGVASIITTPDGTPITNPSNFCRLCNDIIRKTEKGLANCISSDARIGRQNPEGPIVQPCLSGGLWDGGASISVNDQHIANWLVGQVRNEKLNTEQMMSYAKEIDADEKAFAEALEEVKVMSPEQFKSVCDVLFLLANKMSMAAFLNIRQEQIIIEREKAQKQLEKLLGNHEEIIRQRTEDAEESKHAALSLMEDAEAERGRAEKALEKLKLSEQELQDKFDQLERFRRMSVGREMMMIELKKEINELLKNDGKTEKYKIVST